jgi:2-amino-4-hydroxy-6-hydroxymethyldihydropteridine diphosphokinase
LEQAAGRRRDPARRYAPRTLDVDVIMVYAADGTAVITDDPELTLPHPRAHLRAFVLRPWLDVAPDARLPGHGPVAELLRSGVVARDVPAVRCRPDVDLAATLGRRPGVDLSAALRRGAGVDPPAAPAMMEEHRTAPTSGSL